VLAQTLTAVDPTTASPGVAGFLAIFAVAVVTLLLMRDMTKRLRRLRYRQDEVEAPADATPPAGRPGDGR
jgi:hypothetical protein